MKSHEQMSALLWEVVNVWRETVATVTRLVFSMHPSSSSSSSSSDRCRGSRIPLSSPLVDVKDKE